MRFSYFEVFPYLAFILDDANGVFVTSFILFNVYVMKLFYSKGLDPSKVLIYLALLVLMGFLIAESCGVVQPMYSGAGCCQ